MMKQRQQMGGALVEFLPARGSGSIPAQCMSNILLTIYRLFLYAKTLQPNTIYTHC